MKPKYIYNEKLTREQNLQILKNMDLTADQLLNKTISALNKAERKNKSTVTKEKEAEPIQSEESNTQITLG